MEMLYVPAFLAVYETRAPTCKKACQRYDGVSMCVCVCVCVCVSVWMWIYVEYETRAPICKNACQHYDGVCVCVCVCMCVSVCGCMHVCIYVCWQSTCNDTCDAFMSMYVRIHTCMHAQRYFWNYSVMASTKIVMMNACICAFMCVFLTRMQTNGIKKQRRAMCHFVASAWESMRITGYIWKQTKFEGFICFSSTQRKSKKNIPSIPNKNGTSLQHIQTRASMGKWKNYPCSHYGWDKSCRALDLYQKIWNDEPVHLGSSLLCV
jgi:hypothetical protein